MRRITLERRFSCAICVLKTAVIISILLRSSHGSSATQRPFYNIGHMVNSIADLERYMEKGANGIEMDVSFFKNGTVSKVFHGKPCDCFRICTHNESLPEFLSYIRDREDIKSGNSTGQLVLLFINLRLENVLPDAKFHAGQEVAYHLIYFLWNKYRWGKRMNVVISISKVSYAEAIKGFQNTFKTKKTKKFLNHIGYDVSASEKLSDIRQMWSKLGVQSHRWKGYGITNCVINLIPTLKLEEAIKDRDSNNSSSEKVYVWTVDYEAGMRTYLSLGVDTIMTNYPAKLLAIMKDPTFKPLYRLATKYDDPFTRFDAKSADDDEDED